MNWWFVVESKQAIKHIVKARRISLTSHAKLRESERKLSRWIFLATNWLKLFSDSIIFAFQCKKKKETYVNGFFLGKFHCQLHIYAVEVTRQQLNRSEAKTLIGFISFHAVYCRNFLSLSRYIGKVHKIFSHSSGMSLPSIVAREWNWNTFFNLSLKKEYKQKVP